MALDKGSYGCLFAVVVCGGNIPVFWWFHEWEMGDRREALGGDRLFIPGRWSLHGNNQCGLQYSRNRRAHLRDGLVQQRLQCHQSGLDCHKHSVVIQRHLCRQHRRSPSTRTWHDLSTISLLVLDRQELSSSPTFRCIFLDVSFSVHLHTPLHPVILLGSRKHHDWR